MSKILTWPLMCILLATPAWSQEPGPAEPDVTSPAEPIAAEPIAGETTAGDEIGEDSVMDALEDGADVDDELNADLDEQGYEEDEDEFVPTEEIPADEPIPFPSNI